MKRILAILFFSLLFCVHSLCMPAYPGKVRVFINGQKYLICLFGDEHGKRVETEDGYTIVQNSQQQWCFAEFAEDSTLRASKWKLGCCDYADRDFKSFLSSTPKHIEVVPSMIRTHDNIQKASKPAKGQRRILIILMGFQDVTFSKTRLDFEKLFNEEGYKEDGAKGSVRDYYLSASYNQLQLESDIYGPYTASHPMSFYGRNNGTGNGQDVNAYSLFEEAVTNVANDVNLSLYDGDGDGLIDNVHIIFAGYGEEAGAASDAIWSHEATFYRPYDIQGLKIDRYSCAPELRGNEGKGISRIGPHCHEIGHALGAMDYYDTNYATNGEFIGTGKWDIMAAGSWNNEGVTPADFNPYVKAYNYGWIIPKFLPSGDVEIAPSYLSPDNYYILKSSEYGDFYLLENRSKEKWGNGVPGKGLLIFHIHSDIANAGNEINATTPQKCYIVCASSQSKQPNNAPTSYGEINSDGCPYPGRYGNCNFGQSSTPKAFYWNSEECGIELNNISQKDNNIVLNNNSIGAAFKPTEMQSLFFEGFENEETVNPMIETSSWTIEDNPENTMTYIDKPAAYEGVKCLQLSARDSNIDIADSLDFLFIPKNKGRMRISICYTSLHLRFNKPNFLKVGYRTNENPEWNYVTFLSSENNRWRKSYIDLPNNTYPLIRIIGYAYAGSIIAVDNIEVEQELKSEDVWITGLIKQGLSLESIHSISGIKFQKMQKGINVIRDVNGNVYKILAK